VSTSRRRSFPQRSPNRKVLYALLKEFRRATNYTFTRPDRVGRSAIDDSGTGVLLTARTEGFVVGRPDLEETTRRLRAFVEAGADCLYAPGSSPRTRSGR
jgi:hypothetical protein